MSVQTFGCCVPARVSHVIFAKALIVMQAWEACQQKVCENSGTKYKSLLFDCKYIKIIYVHGGEETNMSDPRSLN